MSGPPLLLLLGDQAPEVPSRPDVADRSSLDQQPLGRDLRLRRFDPLGHQRLGDIGVLGHRRPARTRLIELTGLAGQHLAFHRLGVNAADLGGTPIRPDVAVRGNNIHRLPRCQHDGNLSGRFERT
jgi:hypothetical protein